MPKADIRVMVVWIDMRAADNVETARKSATLLDDPRVCHFHDPEKNAGKAIASQLGGEGKIAWDIYLFYDAGAIWDVNLPLPVDWFHQLVGSRWAIREHRCRGPKLTTALERTLKRLVLSQAENRYNLR